MSEAVTTVTLVHWCTELGAKIHGRTVVGGESRHAEQEEPPRSSHAKKVTKGTLALKALLQRKCAGVSAAFGEKSVVAALFHYPTLLENQDTIGPADRA